MSSPTHARGTPSHRAWRHAAAAVALLLNGCLLTVTTDEGGSVRSDPAGIACEPDCSYEFPDDAVVTLTATAEPGYTFSGWEGDCGGTGACTLLMDEERTVAARFAPTPDLVWDAGRWDAGDWQ